MKVTQKRFYLKEFLPFDLGGVLLSGPQSLQGILLQKLHTDTKRRSCWVLLRERHNVFSM